MTALCKRCAKPAAHLEELQSRTEHCCGQAPCCPRPRPPVEVTRGYDCPCLNHEFQVCQLAHTDEPLACSSADKAPPDACPLRRGPVTVRLRMP